MCRALVGAGADVLCTDIDGEAAAAGCRRVRGRAARAARLDVTDAAAVRAAVDGVVARAGRLDLMFNNAGIAWGGDTELLTLDQWNAIIDVNIRGVVHGVAAAYPLMVRQGHGHIVNTASMGGLTAAGQITSYVMTKHAVVGLSLALRSEAAARGVGVTALCPAAVETPILDKGAIGGFVGRDYYLRGRASRPLRCRSAGAGHPGGDRTQQGAADQAADGARAQWLFARLAPGLMQRASIRFVESQRGHAGRGRRLVFTAVDTEFTLTQKRALAVVTVIAVLFGAYFLRHYFILVVIAAIVAYLFTPVYNRCRVRFNTGLSAAITVLAALATVIIPLGLLITLAVLQISHMVVHVAEWVQTADVSTLGDQAIDFINRTLAKLPFGHFTVTAESLRQALVSVSQNVGEFLLREGRVRLAA